MALVGLEQGDPHIIEVVAWEVEVDRFDKEYRPEVLVVFFPAGTTGSHVSPLASMTYISPLIKASRAALHSLS
jgi:hypothetical protein